MQDSLDPRSEAQTPTAESRTNARPEAAADREIPAHELPTAVHAWLDGELVAESQLSGAQKELSLWKRIGAETGRRRRMTTPSHIQAQILSKLTDD